MLWSGQRGLKPQEGFGPQAHTRSGARMTSDGFAYEDWVDRIALALPGLAKAQKPFLREYWEQNGGVHVVYDRRSGKPVFPLDDLRDLYAMVRNSNAFGKREHYAPLCEVLDSVRHILLSHPALARVVGPIIGRDNFWMQILNAGTSSSPTDLIAGLLARAHELSGDPFRQAASEMKALLDPGVERGSAFVPGELDVGYNMMLFYGLTVTEVIDVADGIAILPYEDVRPFVNESLVDELSPDGARFHHWRSVGAVVRPFRWRPALNRSGYEREPVLERPKSLFLDARSILDLLAVAHEAAVVPLAELPHCINRSAARLLGWDGHGPNASWRNPAKNSDGFEKCPELAPTAFTEAKEAFDNRTSHQYAKMAPIVSRLAETLDPKGRFAAETRVGEIGAALERMYDVGKRKISPKLQNRISGFLGTDDESRESIKTTVKEFYDARSEIVHGRTDKMSPLRTNAAFVKGFKIARRSVFKLLREGPPDDWNALIDGEH